MLLLLTLPRYPCGSQFYTYADFPAFSCCRIFCKLNRACFEFFLQAIQSNPLAGEAWKRRGQARAALGESVEAILRVSHFESNLY